MENGTKLTWKEYNNPYWSNNARQVFIDLPESVLDEYITVLGVIIEGKLEIQR